MTKIITRILFAALLFAGVGVSVASAQSLTLSTDPSYANSYTHYCPPYTESFVQDGVYSPSDRSCVYSIPNDVRAIGTKMYMLFYEGTPGNATLLRSEPVVDGANPSTLVRVQSIGPFVGTFQTGDKFFGAVVPSGPIDSSNEFPELEQFNLAFTTGTTTPHNTYHLIGWELGEFDTLGPNVTITSPVEGATYQSTDSVPLLSDVTDPSGVQSVLYTINDTAVIQPNQPLPFDLVPLGPAYINAYAVDTLGNETFVTINFTIVPPTTDACPNVPGTQASGPCADQVCVSGGGTWDGDSCNYPGPVVTKCLHALSANAKPAVKVGGSANLLANCMLQVNSNGVGAVDIQGSAKIATNGNCVVGTVKKSGSPTVTPAPTIPCTPVADPFAQVVAPTIGACDYTNFKVNGSQVKTLNPGVYCGGLDISGSAKVTLNPGLYIVKDGDLNINGSAKVTGTDVSFYITGAGAAVNLGGSSETRLAAPTGGSLPKTLFFLAGAAGAKSEINGSAKLVMSGYGYFPTQNFRASGSGHIEAAAGSALVANMFELNGSAKIEVK